MTLRSLARRMSARAVLGQFQRDLAAHQRGEGEKPHQRAFQHADIGRDAMRKVFQYAIGDDEARILQAVLLDLLLQNAKAQFDSRSDADRRPDRIAGAT